MNIVWWRYGMKPRVVVLAALLVLALCPAAGMAQGLSGVVTGGVALFETVGSDRDPAPLAAESVTTPEKLATVEGTDTNAPVMVEQ